MAEKIIIQIELDTDSLDKQREQIKKEIERDSQEIGENLEGAINQKIVKNIEGQLKTLEVSSDRLNDSFKDTSDSIGDTFKSFSQASVAGAALVPIVKNLNDLKTLGAGLAAVFFKGKGLFGFISALSGSAIALRAIAVAMKEIDNPLTNTIALFANLTAILLGGFAAGLAIATVKIGQLVNRVGTDLVTAFDNAAKSFNKTEQSVLVLNALIDNFNRSTGNAIGTTQEWSKTIDNLSTNFNISNNAIRKSAQEIIAVGSQYGLAQKELEKLLKVSVEYAKVNRKDVFQTTVNIVSALAGNAQAVQALGIKLNQASVQQFAFSQGISKSINELSENEKVQLRFNKLLKQYKDITGIAAVAAGSFGDQQARLEVNQRRLANAFGSGARIIEQNSILAAGLNLVLNNVSESSLKVTGFIGALGARLLQVGGLVLEFGLKIFGVIKVFKLLNVLLSSNVGINLFATQIPLVSKSLNQLISRVAGTSVKITSLNSLVSSFGIIGRGALDRVTLALFGVQASALTLGTAFSGAFTKIKAVIARVLPFIARIGILLLPIIIKIALVVAAFKLLSAAFTLLEKKTKIFSTTFNLLKTAFEDGLVAFQPILKIIKEFGEKVLTAANQAFGFFVDKIAAGFELLTGIIASNPFGLFSQQTVDAFSDVNQKIQDFRNEIALVAFDLRKLPDEAGRSIAGLNETFEEINLEKLFELKRLFDDFGKTDLELLEEQLTERLDLVNAALDQELIDLEQGERLKNKILKDSSNKRFKLLNKSAIRASKQLQRILQNGLVRVVTVATAQIGAALATGSFSFKTFSGTIIGVIGDLLLQLGAAFIAIGFGIEAIKNSALSLSGGQAIAAGLALLLIGGALKAVAGGLGGSVSPGIPPTPPGFGDSAFGDSGFDASGGDLADEDEREDTGPTITVIIQGDVFDTSETGIRIVEIINDAFDTEGSTINQAAIA